MAKVFDLAGLAVGLPSTMPEPITCPFCGYKNHTGYAIQLHIEEHHTDGSPFAVQEPPPTRSLHSGRSRPGSSKRPRDQTPIDQWTQCTRPGCSENVHLAQIDEHLEMHDAIAAVEREERRCARNNSNNNDDSRHTISIRREQYEADALPAREKLQRRPARSPPPSQNGRLLKYFSGSSLASMGSSLRNPLKERQPLGRLGTKELGPYAFEKSMPGEVRRQLESGAKGRSEKRIGRDGRLARETVVPNETSGLIPILADLSDLDATVRRAYFCSRVTKHVHKLACEGNFCGYWNIQMLLSHVYATGADEPLRKRPLPNVLQIQDTIEAAWDAGTCTYGRVETGGIRNTRKWIGTHEAAAYFMHTGLPVQALSFKTSDAAPQSAHEQLLDYVEAYLISGLEEARRYGKSSITCLPPIFFQRAGHSMTIVGLERRRDGGRDLVVFDPSAATSTAMKRLVDGKAAHVMIETLLDPYRHHEARLVRWKEYEVLACNGR